MSGSVKTLYQDFGLPKTRPDFISERHWNIAQKALVYGRTQRSVAEEFQITASGVASICETVLFRCIVYEDQAKSIGLDNIKNGCTRLFNILWRAGINAAEIREIDLRHRVVGIEKDGHVQYKHLEGLGEFYLKQLLQTNPEIQIVRLSKQQAKNL